MKGITPVVALILLLVIVIVIVGFSFGIFQSLIQTSGGAAEEQAGTTAGQVTKTVRIESAANGTATDTVIVSVRNIGAQSIAGADVGVYVNGVLQTCTWSPTTIPAGGVSTCTTGATVTNKCLGGKTVRVTSPSGAAETTVCY